MATFYRVVKYDPPTPDDFLSRTEMGLPPPAGASAEEIVSNDLVSVWDSFKRARDLARAFKRMGRYVVKIDIPDGAAIGFQPTSTLGHYDLTGGTGAAILQYWVPPARQVK